MLVYVVWFISAYSWYCCIRVNAAKEQGGEGGSGRKLLIGEIKGRGIIAELTSQNSRYSWAGVRLSQKEGSEQPDWSSVKERVFATVYILST